MIVIKELSFCGREVEYIEAEVNTQPLLVAGRLKRIGFLFQEVRQPDSHG